MKNKKKIIILLVIIISLLVVIMASIYIQNLKKEIPPETIKSDGELYAIYVEETPNSEEYLLKDNTPGSGYTLNNRKSNCVDIEGNLADTTISYDSNTGNISVDASKSVMCYIYFDMDEVNQVENFSTSLLTNPGIWSSGLEGDGYRFIGTKPNNYVCFGTDNKGTCLDNPNTYLYQVVGVFKNNDNNYTKLIKSTPLANTYKWHSTTDNISWNDSELYTGLNASYFLNNKSYNYFQNNLWKTKIVNWDYPVVNTLTISDNGLDYKDVTPQHIYLHELNKNGKSSTVGEWKTVSSKVGLMSISDYVLSLGDTSKNLTTGINDNTELLKTSWLYSSSEWLMSRFGMDNEINNIYSINSTGGLSNTPATNQLSIRPVFYLDAQVQYLSGTGTITDPYILDSYILPTLSATFNTDNRVIKLNISSNDFITTSYCVNNKPSDTTGCIWNKDSIKDKEIIYEPKNLIYVHLKDMNGRIIHSNQLDTRI